MACETPGLNGCSQAMNVRVHHGKGCDNSTSQYILKHILKRATIFNAKNLQSKSFCSTFAKYFKNEIHGLLAQSVRATDS